MPSRAAALPTAGVSAWRALVTEGRVRAGDTVMVQGTGGVSLFALRFAKMLSAFVIITSSRDSKLDQARTLGADGVINYRTTPKWDEAARQIADNGVDHIVKVGGRDNFEAMTRAISQHNLRPVVDRTFAFDELHQVLDYLASGQHFGKSCIRH